MLCKFDDVKGDENHDLHDGMSALSKTIRDANAEQRERTECVLVSVGEIQVCFLFVIVMRVLYTLYV